MLKMYKGSLKGGLLNLLLLVFLIDMILVRRAGVLLDGPKVQVAVLPEQLLQLEPVLDLLTEDLQHAGTGGRPCPHVPKKIGEKISTKFMRKNIRRTFRSGRAARVSSAPPTTATSWRRASWAGNRNLASSENPEEKIEIIMELLITRCVSSI